jgi:hypothetical protein
MGEITLESAPGPVISISAAGSAGAEVGVGEAVAFGVAVAVGEAIASASGEVAVGFAAAVPAVADAITGDPPVAVGVPGVVLAWTVSAIDVGSHSVGNAVIRASGSA